MKIYEHDIYVGKVIYIDDITRTGRCKIRVYGLFDELDDDNIPWFTPVNSSIFSKNGGGSLDVPKIGTIVRVTFENGDVYAGQYMALENVDPALVNEIKDLIIEKTKITENEYNKHLKGVWWMTSDDAYKLRVCTEILYTTVLK